jgi:hypothetical protein
MMNPGDARSYAGLLAASNVVVSKHIPLRNPPPTNLRARLRPSTLLDAPRLLGSGDLDTSLEHRLARLTSAALLYSANKADTTFPTQLLSDDELEAFHKVVDGVRGKGGAIDDDKLASERTCPYCRILFDTYYQDVPTTTLPIVIVNHAAHVRPDFDPIANIASAAIRNFQFLIPAGLGEQLLELSHPLNWRAAVPALFKRSDALETRNGAPGNFLQGTAEHIRETWDAAFAKGDGFGFLFEDVSWPWNESLSADVENILRIDEFGKTPHDWNPRFQKLMSYRYSLEECIQSNYGVAWERGGLDIDDGIYRARMQCMDDLTHTDVAHLHKRDLLHMRLALEPGSRKILDELHGGWNESEDALAPHSILAEVRAIAGELSSTWKTDFHLVTVAASKRLHFTVPRNSPADLWRMLTWTAPAFLMTFLNRAICQSPHELVRKALLDGEYAVGGNGKGAGKDPVGSAHVMSS